MTHDTAKWRRTMQIDAGSRDGVRLNMPVLTPQGLVGREDEVGYTSSRVVLLGDPNCRVSAMVWGTKDRGVVLPGSATALDPSLVSLTFLPRHSTIKPGAFVYTSGEGGIFPDRILIGQI